MAAVLAGREGDWAGLAQQMREAQKVRCVRVIATFVFVFAQGRLAGPAPAQLMAAAQQVWLQAFSLTAVAAQ